MPLKNKYTNAGDIPAELKSFYLEHDGAWLLDSERNDELRQTNITVMKERDALLKRFDGIDPDDVRKTAAEKRRLEEEMQLKAGEFEKVHAARLAEWQKLNHAPVVARLEASDARLAGEVIDKSVLVEATKRGLRPPAIPDIIARARAEIRLVNGEPRIFKGDVVVLGKDGVTPATVAEWVDALAPVAPHYFEANAGGGAAGSGSRGVPGGGSANPFSKKTENITEQMKLLKSDPALAARLKASA